MTLRFVQSSPVLRLLLLGISCILATTTASSQTPAWTTGGPYVGDDINCLVGTPANPTVFYACGIFGIYQSTDDAATWTRLTDIEAGSIAISTSNPDVIFAVSDDKKSVFKSDDGGLSWSDKSLANSKVNALVVHPTDPDVVFLGVGTGGTSGPKRGFYKSTDGGDSWVLKTDYELDAVYSIALDTSNPDHIYAAVSPDWFANGQSGMLIRRSTDGGETWVSFLAATDFFDRMSLVMMTPAGHSPPTLYAKRGDDYLRSLDFGETWSSLHAPTSGDLLTIDPSNPEILYLGHDNTFYRSTNGGTNWSQDLTGLPQDPDCDPTGVHVHPSTGNVTVGCSGGQGVLRSTDQASTWTYIGNARRSVSLRYLAAHKDDAQRVYAVLDDGHLTVSSDGGESWTLLENAPDSLGAVAIDPQNPSTVWAGQGYRTANSFYVYRSLDSGNTWTTINYLTFSPDAARTGVTDILIHPDEPDKVLVGSSYEIVGAVQYGRGIIARTTDFGATWSQVANTTATMAMDPTDPNTIYFGKNASPQMFKGLQVWGNKYMQEITPLGSVGYVSDVEVDTNSDAYFATLYGLRIWNGTEWTTNTSLPANSVTSIAIDHSKTPNILYVGTREPDGVYVSEDGGATWTDFTDGANFAHPDQLVLSNGFLYATVDRGSVWKRAAIATSGVAVDDSFESPSAYRLLQNYPNPFNPSTTIVFEVPEASRVRLSVYDASGRLVSTLVDRFVMAGSHTVAFKSTNLSSGAYLYRLDTPNRTFSRTMLILK